MQFGPIYLEYFSAVYYGLTLKKFALSIIHAIKIVICLNVGAVVLAVVGVVVLAVVGVVVVGISGTLKL